MKIRFVLIAMCCFLGLNVQAQSDNMDDMQNQMLQMQQEMMRLFQEFPMAPNEDGVIQFDTTFSYSFSYPMTPFGQGMDSLGMNDMDMQMRMFSPFGQFPLEDMMNELNQMDQQDWSQIEEMMRQFQQTMPMFPFDQMQPIEPREEGAEPADKKKKKKRKVTRI